jgi:pimeloyl-ACP methyl ester carboxylesterase
MSAGPIRRILTGSDETLRDVFARLAELGKERQSVDPTEFCKKFWSILRLIENIFPSLRDVNLAQEDMSRVSAPVLTIHGTRDRSAPYGGGRDWAMLLPTARLVTVENAGHAPWIEGPGKVFDSIETFLEGAWPAAAQKVESS